MPFLPEKVSEKVSKDSFRHLASYESSDTLDTLPATLTATSAEW